MIARVADVLVDLVGERPQIVLDTELRDRIHLGAREHAPQPDRQGLLGAELELIAGLCRDHDAIAITDEIYEHMVYDGEHKSLATVPGMAERTITISGASKTYSVTGWRVGWLVAPPRLTDGIRKVHDFLTVGAPAPLQQAAAAGMAFGPEYYNSMAQEYRARRDVIVEGLTEAGFAFSVPEGAYYIMADFSALSDLDDTKFSRWLATEIGVAPVPGSSFYHDGGGKTIVRFAFSKQLSTLEKASERLATIRARV